jgi:hypothetical protein
MLPELPSFEADEAFLRAMGRAGGLCDCGDIADAPASLSSVAAGRPIFGQFVAHGITADRSALQSHVDPRALRNARAPQLNLECPYGDGPVGHPFLFQRDDPAKFLVGVDGADVPRNVEGIATILDEFLPSLVGRGLVDEIMTGGSRWFRPNGEVFIPLEFADAA